MSLSLFLLLLAAAGIQAAGNLISGFEAWLPLWAGLATFTVIAVAGVPWQLGDAQIKNLTDRLNGLIGQIPGLIPPGPPAPKVDVTNRTIPFPPGNSYGDIQMTQQFNVDLQSGRTVGHEWKLELSGDGQWSVPNTLRFYWRIGALGQAVNVSMINLQGNEFLPDGEQFSYSLTGTFTVVNVAGVNSTAVVRLSGTLTSRVSWRMENTFVDLPTSTVYIGSLRTMSMEQNEAGFSWAGAPLPAAIWAGYGGGAVTSHRSVLTEYGP